MLLLTIKQSFVMEMAFHRELLEESITPSGSTQKRLPKAIPLNTVHFSSGQKQTNNLLMVGLGTDWQLRARVQKAGQGHLYDIWFRINSKLDNVAVDPNNVASSFSSGLPWKLLRQVPERSPMLCETASPTWMHHRRHWSPVSKDSNHPQK